MRQRHRTDVLFHGILHQPSAAINSDGWKLQGSYGRAMKDAIESGRRMLGMNPTRDY